MTDQDLSASTGTLDTSETGGAAPAHPAVVTDTSSGIPEGRAFRPEAETRDLVNAAYGVEDADPYPVVEDEIPEGQIVADEPVPSPEDLGAVPVVEGDPQPTDVTNDPEALAAAEEAAQAAEQETVDESVQAEIPAVSDVPEAPSVAPEDAPVLAPGSEAGADAITVHDPVQEAQEAVAAAEAALATPVEAPADEPQP